MSFLNLTSDQLDTLSTLVERGLNDMNQHQKEGDLVQDGYSEGDIEAFHQTVEEGNKIQGLVGPAKVRATARSKAVSFWQKPFYKPIAA